LRRVTKSGGHTSLWCLSILVVNRHLMQPSNPGHHEEARTSFTNGEIISASACSLKACTRATASPNKLFTVLLFPTLDLPAQKGATWNTSMLTRSEHTSCQYPCIELGWEQKGEVPAKPSSDHFDQLHLNRTSVCMHCEPTQSLNGCAGRFGHLPSSSTLSCLNPASLSSCKHPRTSDRSWRQPRPGKHAHLQGICLALGTEHE